MNSGLVLINGCAATSCQAVREGDKIEAWVGQILDRLYRFDSVQSHCHEPPVSGQAIKTLFQDEKYVREPHGPKSTTTSLQAHTDSDH